MFLSMGNEPLHQVGASIKLHLDGPFYAGIGVCSAQQPDVLEKATFSHVELGCTSRRQPRPATLALYSTLQTIEHRDNFRRAIGDLPRSAPILKHPTGLATANLSSSIRTDASGPSPWTVETPQLIDTGAATRLHRQPRSLARRQMARYHLRHAVNPETPCLHRAFRRGPPRLVTENPASYFHSWSPDGKTIVFTRPSHGSGNIYAISVDGGAETALTTGTGISDDPDYSPDGQYIYFNSDRTGSHADLAHARRRQPARASHLRRVPATGRRTPRPTANPS